MARTMFDLLEGALEELGEDQFKKFKNKLSDRGQEYSLPKGAVEKKDEGEIARLLIDRFTEKGALKFSLQILGIIKAVQTAEDLEKEAAANGFSADAGSGGSLSTATPNQSLGGPPVAVMTDAAKAAFIKDKAEELVQRATAMDGLLDALLDKNVIDDEQYSDICSKSSNQIKMRCLIREALRACGDSGKAILYDVLMAKRALMMKDLGAS